MAASYPLEIVEAARWLQANPGLKGDAAVNAVGDKSWDVSVKSLVAFPPALMQLNDHLDWTQNLGDAMIGQQQDVADSIQRLRARAADAGNLQSGQQQTGLDPGHRQRPHDRHRADQPRRRLRAVLQSVMGLRVLARSRLPTGLLSAGAGLRLRNAAGDRPDVGRRPCRRRCDVQQLELVARRGLREH